MGILKGARDAAAGAADAYKKRAERNRPKTAADKEARKKYLIIGGGAGSPKNRD